MKKHTKKMARRPLKDVMTAGDFARIRAKLKMTQQEIADALGIKNPATISNWERGQTPIGSDRAAAIRLLESSHKDE